MGENINWLQILSVGTNLGVLIVGIKLVRYLSRMEFQVNLMWRVFSKQFGKDPSLRNMFSSSEEEEET